MATTPTASGTTTSESIIPFGYELDEEHRLLHDTIRDFAESEVLPGAGERDVHGTFPAEIIKKLGEMGYMGATLASFLFVPYFFLGLSVVHAIPLAGPGRYALLGLFYFLLLLLAWPAIPVGLLGLWEQWSGLRAKLKGGPGREDK